ncbi:MAG: hypothetical protein P4L56_03810 [Candidatus Sulfopaludibacter sp.]|nr:hypothetical protein [Candidatus Sulfopaludibacter sp.]
MILVDSSVWIDYFKGTVTAQTEILDGLLGQQPLAIGDLILTEVLQVVVQQVIPALGAACRNYGIDTWISIRSRSTSACE